MNMFKFFPVKIVTMSIQKKVVLKKHIVESHHQDIQEYTHRIGCVDITSRHKKGD
jgi:hypothetical protein